MDLKKNEYGPDNGISAELTAASRLNLGMVRNSCPFVYELKLTNHTHSDLTDLDCVFSSSPEVVTASRKIHIPQLKSKEVLLLTDLELEYDLKMLSGLQEPEDATLQLDVFSGETLLKRICTSFKLYAPDHWQGTRIQGELLASFVVPLVEVMAEVKEHASGELSELYPEGFGSKHDQIRGMCQAVYNVLLSRRIELETVQSGSDFISGTKLRFADWVYHNGKGTALEVALLFASVMERWNLHTVLLVFQNQLYVGCHLTDYFFQDVLTDDLQMVCKRVEQGDLLLFDGSMICYGSSFSQAESHALSRYMKQEKDFEFALDISCARSNRIFSLPLYSSIRKLDFRRLELCTTYCPETSLPEENIFQEECCPPPSNVHPRIAHWTKKLLDLTLRNRLLNVRDTKLIIPLAGSYIGELEDQLSQNESFTIHACADPQVKQKSSRQKSSSRTSFTFPDLSGAEKDETIDAQLRQELSMKRLWSPLQENDLEKRQIALYRKGKTDLEEGGVNTLFLAMGFLEWKMTASDEKSCLAPILLLPVRLHRKSVREKFKLSRFDGETLINETLLEMLRTQFQLTIPDLQVLPQDESGVNVPRVMQIFRHAIADMEDWQIHETAKVGCFSFGKFVMWTDMTAKQDVLKQHPVIDHLIRKNGTFDDGIEVFAPEEVSRYLDLKNLYCPLSADSSQLAALLYSQMGKNFVLHGPPGTGKSQTITNIIAHNLALGKRVLFVSEKKAALDVVYKRLTQIGLKSFCLELHSNRSGKTEVLKQFSEALRLADSAMPGEWERCLESLTQYQKTLESYVQELHKQYANGYSAYDCFSVLLNNHAQDDPDLGMKELYLDTPRQECDDLRRLFLDWVNSRKRICLQDFSFLEKIDLFQWNPLTHNELLKIIKETLSTLDRLLDTLNETMRIMGLEEESFTTLSELTEMVRLLGTVKQSGNIPEQFLNGNTAKQNLFLETYFQKQSRLQEMEEKLKFFRLDTFSDYDFTGIRQQLSQNDSAFFLLRMIKNFFLIRELRALKKNGSAKLTVQELRSILPDAEQYDSVRQYVQKQKNKASSLLLDQWNDGSVDWDSVKKQLNDAGAVSSTIHALCSADEERANRLLNSFQSFMPRITQLCKEGSVWHTQITVLEKCLEEFQNAFSALAPYSAALHSANEIVSFRKDLTEIITHYDELRNVFRCRELHEQLRNAGLRGFSAVLKKEDPQTFDFAALYDKVFFNTLLTQILQQSPMLRNHNGVSHEDWICMFCKLDAEYMMLTRKVIFAKLAARLPRRRKNLCPEGAQLGILQRECEKRARQKPVRLLLELIPNLIPVLKPCFLMSPLSVAQYLPPDETSFDLVIFDEASQIPVWDAVGVIARGKQLIVVGDPKQMPPSTFFQKGDVEEEEEDFTVESEDTGDLESILDECIGAGLHSTYLNWHYRSRHESLIAFSNHHYYQDRLFTFPAAENYEKLGIRFEFVPDGVYDRRMSRTNLKEAQALVAYIFDRLERSSPSAYRSIGVVTFSQAQKDLIEDLLEKERRNHPALEEYFSDSCDEGLFVKNLENVQGDERDVILFSVGYAPDAQGKFSMNFGPLNRQGGERRLNVAITRAKEQVVVFSSIHAEQIDLSRTNATGAAHLKYFLDYAEKRLRIYNQNTVTDHSDGVVEHVRQFLTEHGFKVESNVGNSSCRIPLAVLDPDDEKRFLLGIEFDNRDYASRATVRDRDDLRMAVLSNLNWRIFRVWSTDWMFDGNNARKDLLAFIEKVRQNKAFLFPEETQSNSQEMMPQGMTFGVETVSHEPEPEYMPETEYIPEAEKEYSCWVYTGTSKIHEERFFKPSAKKLIRQHISQIIEQEAPVYEDTVRKRLSKAWGFSRITPNLQKVFQECLPQNGMLVTRSGDRRVFWGTELTPENYSFYRTTSSEEQRRPVEDIPVEELANGMYQLYCDFHSCDKETLLRETIKLFGFSVLTAKSRSFLEEAYLLLKKQGRL